MLLKKKKESPPSLPPHLCPGSPTLHGFPGNKLLQQPCFQVTQWVRLPVWFKSNVDFWFFQKAGHVYGKPGHVQWKLPVTAKQMQVSIRQRKPFFYSPSFLLTSLLPPVPPPISLPPTPSLLPSPLLASTQLSLASCDMHINLDNRSRLRTDREEYV